MTRRLSKWVVAARDLSCQRDVHGKAQLLAVFKRSFGQNTALKARIGNEPNKTLWPYSQNPDAFVSEYAASNAVEDLAETFATFVLTEGPTGMSEKNQKIQFLYESPSMVAERTRIRAALASEIK